MIVTWVGHATVLIEVAGLRVVTDPLLTSRVAHLRRRVPLPDVGRVDAVLVSHAHMDHLHVPSLRRVATGARALIPQGTAPLVEPLGFDVVTSVRTGDRVVIAAPGGEVVIDVVQADHLSGRGPHSTIHAAPVGYVVRGGGRSVYFAGDTDLFDGMRDLGPLDLALLPIWGWGHTLGERHLDPDSAAVATEWIAPARVVPIHWGTYSPVRIGRGPPRWIGEPLDAFATTLGARRLDHLMVGMRPGGSITLE